MPFTSQDAISCPLCAKIIPVDSDTGSASQAYATHYYKEHNQEIQPHTITGTK